MLSICLSTVTSWVDRACDVIIDGFGCSSLYLRVDETVTFLAILPYVKMTYKIIWERVGRATWEPTAAIY